MRHGGWRKAQGRARHRRRASCALFRGGLRRAQDQGRRGERLAPHKPRCRSITFDNGLEFASHLEVGSALGAETFFADPCSSWQRGTNEWLNGRLRRHFPKGMPLTGVTDGEMQAALDKINAKPMKVLVRDHRPSGHLSVRRPCPEG